MKRFFETLYDVAFYAREAVVKNITANVYKVLVKNGYDGEKDELANEIEDDVFGLVSVKGDEKYKVTLASPVPFWGYTLTRDLKVVGDRGVLGDASKPMYKRNERIEDLIEPYFDDLKFEVIDRIGRAVKTRTSKSGLYILDLANLVTRYPGKKFKTAVVKIADGDVYIEFFDKQFYAKYEVFTDKGVLEDKINGSVTKTFYWEELVMLMEHFHGRK